jgi:hypothetical protein
MDWSEDKSPRRGGRIAARQQKAEKETGACPLGQAPELVEKASQSSRPQARRK